MTRIAAGLDAIDLEFRGTPDVIATAVLHSPGGVALVDPGPTSCLPRLNAALESSGITWRDVRALLVTHIHLDHAGAAGTIVGAHPHIAVYVHERGARHLVDPSRLLASATQLYGAEMDQLWGEVAPVPAARVTALAGGERVEAAGRTLEVLYTPGHASHHVSWFDRSSGVAFTGDTAGIRHGSGRYVMPPTPPPDVDLDAWNRSLDAILAWGPDTLFVTHFGAWSGARPHLEELRARLADWAERARVLVGRADLDDAARQAAFRGGILADLGRHVPPGEVAAYERAGRVDYSWLGLARYWHKRSQRS